MRNCWNFLKPGFYEGIILAIESFVGQNIEELGGFGRGGLAEGFRRLLDKYNERVEDTETDRSLLIKLPANL